MQVVLLQNSTGCHTSWVRFYLDTMSAVSLRAGHWQIDQLRVRFCPPGLTVDLVESFSYKEVEFE